MIKILLDGYDLRELNVKSLRDSIGVVSQEPILFDGTLEENIMLGNEFATRDDVKRYCKMVVLELKNCLLYFYINLGKCI